MKKNDGSSLYCQLSQLAFGPFRSQRPGAFDSEPTHYLPQKTRDIIWPILCFTASVSCHAPSRRVAPSSKIHRLSLKKKNGYPPPHLTLAPSTTRVRRRHGRVPPRCPAAWARRRCKLPLFFLSHHLPISVCFIARIVIKHLIKYFIARVPCSCIVYFCKAKLYFFQADKKHIKKHPKCVWKELEEVCYVEVESLIVPDLLVELATSNSFVVCLTTQGAHTQHMHPT